MATLLFGKSWFRAKKQFTDMWDEAKARLAHEQRRPYAALVKNDGIPRCFIEVNNAYFGVGFLDSAMRVFTNYSFQELERGRLFLTMATHREFAGETDRVTSGTTYFFKPDGKLVIASEDFVASQRTEKESHADVSGNWEKYPSFGDYDSIAKLER